MAAVAAVKAASVRQGDVLRVTAKAPAESARLLERSIRLFPQPNGERLGLMPVPADQKPGTYRLEILDGQNTVVRRNQVTVRNAHFLKQNVRLKPEIETLKPAPGEVETAAALRKTVSDVRYWREPFAVPVRGCMSSPFGVQRYYNGKAGGNYHSGLDLPAKEGDPVHTMADGVVRLVRPFNVHGNTVGVDHGQGLVSMYLHLSKFAVAEGAAVKKGDVVGYAGSTGRSTAPHVHWSVFANGVSTNPLQWAAVKPCGGKKPLKRRKSAGGE